MDTQPTSIEKLTAQMLVKWLGHPNPPCLVEFHASWCIYHLLTARKLEALARELGDKVRFGTIDVEGNEELLRSLGIHQVPTIGYYTDHASHLWVGDTDLEVMIEDIAGCNRKDAEV